MLSVDMVYDIHNDEIGLENFQQESELLTSHPEAIVDLIKTIADYCKAPWPSVGTGDWCRWYIYDDSKKCPPKTRRQGWSLAPASIMN